VRERKRVSERKKGKSEELCEFAAFGWRVMMMMMRKMIKHYITLHYYLHYMKLFYAVSRFIKFHVVLCLFHPFISFYVRTLYVFYVWLYTYTNTYGHDDEMIKYADVVDVIKMI